MAASPVIDAKAIRARAAEVKASARVLDATVASGEERRCPFLKMYPEETKENPEPEAIDAVCDVRIQRFNDLPPFGPLDLNLCDLCIRAKDMQMKDDQFE